MLRNHAAWSLGIEHTHLAPQRLFSPSTNARGAYTTTGVKSSDNRGASFAGVAHLHPLPSPIFPPRGRVLWAVAGRQAGRRSAEVSASRARARRHRASSNTLQKLQSSSLCADQLIHCPGVCARREQGATTKKTRKSAATSEEGRLLC